MENITKLKFERDWVESVIAQTVPDKTSGTK